jgi:hypothetical protein
MYSFNYLLIYYFIYVGAEESGLVSDKPEKLEGWIEKKSESKMGLGSEWQKRFVRIDESTGSMVYYKTANTSDKPSGTIDLRMVADISAYSKGGGEITSYSR